MTLQIRGMLRLLENRGLLTLLLLGAIIWSLASVDWSGPLVHAGGLATVRDFFLALLPPELSPGFLRLAQAAYARLAV